MLAEGAIESHRETVSLSDVANLECARFTPSVSARFFAASMKAFELSGRCRRSAVLADNIEDILERSTSLPQPPSMIAPPFLTPSVLCTQRLASSKACSELMASRLIDAVIRLSRKHVNPPMISAPLLDVPLRRPAAARSHPQANLSRLSACGQHARRCYAQRFRIMRAS